MDQDEKGSKTLGDEVMEQVGKLKALTKELKETDDGTPPTRS